MLDRKKISEPILYLVLIIALLAPRLPGLDSYVTLDEPYWLSMGSNFYYALGQREFRNTVYEYQPAVTTMWMVTAAMLVYFPEYRGFGQGYPYYNKDWLDTFLIAHGKHPLELLQIARVIQVFVITLLFLILYSLLKRFINKYAAAFVILFASFDPFFLSQSRILDHEALLSLLVMISTLSLLAYFSHERRFVFLLISGFAAGLAQLTKSSALAILAPIGILFLIQTYRDLTSFQNRSGLWRVLLSNAKIFFLWLGLLIAAYFIFWPGMWVAPGKMLYEVYGNAFSYAFQGGRLSVTGELESSTFSLETGLGGIFSLSETLLRRTTPLTWLGILFGFLLLRTPKRHPEFTEGSPDFGHMQNQEILRSEMILHSRILFVLFWITAAAFIVMFGVAQGRNSPHYILSSYLALNLLAGLGWSSVAQEFPRRLIQWAVVIAALVFQLGSAIPYFPYYFTYENPIPQRENADAPLFPYGEGLESAAQYLAELPNAKNSTALVYYSRGCFSYFYPGKTEPFKNYYTDGNHAEELTSAIRSADYLVVYSAVQDRLAKYKGYTEALSSIKPLHEVWLDGRKYAVIYQVNQIPTSVFEQLENLPISE